MDRGQPAAEPCHAAAVTYKHAFTVAHVSGLGSPSTQSRHAGAVTYKSAPEWIVKS